MTPAELASIESAIVSVNELLRAAPAEVRYDLRQDLRQELGIKVFQAKIGITGLRVAARRWLLSYFRDRRRQLDLEAEYAAGARPGAGRRAVNWEPTWYAPHEDACEFAPLACIEARLMHVKSTQTHADVTDALVDFIDFSYRKGS